MKTSSKQNEFAASLELLIRIRSSVGDRGLIGVAWDGNLLRVTHALPDSNKKMWVMTFDDIPSDFLIDMEALLSNFAKGSAEHFK